MSCTRYRDLLSRYIDGEVTARQRRELLEHLDHCHDCAAWLARARQTDVLLKGVSDTGPSDRVRDAVLGSALTSRAPGDQRLRPAGHPHFPVGGGWHLEAAGLLMRFDITPQRAALGLAAMLISMVGLAYWLNLLPPLGGYDKFGFLFPRDQEPAPISGGLQAVSSGYNGVGGSIAAPNLVRLTPSENAQDIAPQQPLRVRFDLPMDRSSAQDALRIDPPAAGAFSWDADNEFSFTPAGDGLLRGITYTVTLSNSARSLAGTPMTQPLSWSFRTTNPPSVAASLPAGAAVYPTATFTLSFDQAMDASKTNGEVSLTAEGSGAALPVSLSWSPDGRTLSVAPLGPMTANATVALRVAASASSRTGATLGYPSELTYTVTLPTPRLRLADGRVSISDTGNPAPVAVEAFEAPGVPLEGVSFEVYSLPGDRLSELQAQTQTHSWPAPLPLGLPGSLQKVLTVQNQDAQDNTNPQAGRKKQDLSGLAPGTYLLLASARSSAGAMLSDWQLLVIADRRLASLDGGALWATGPDGKPWPRAEISFYSPAEALLDKGLTDDAGLWQPSQASRPSLVIARDPQGHLAAMLPPTSPGTTYPSQPPGPQSLPASLQTDLPSYRPGQQVNFRAVLHPPAPEHAWRTPIAEQDVSVTLLDPQGAALSVLTLKPDSVGGVSGLFALAPSTRAGQYLLRVKAGDAWRDFPLDVLPASSDTLSVFVAPPTDASYRYRSLDTQAITRTVSVLGPRGEAAAGSLLTATLRIRGDNWVSAPVTATTGPDGLATVVVPLTTWTGIGPAGPAVYYDPSLYLQVQAAWQGNSGSGAAALDMRTASRLLSGMVDLASPSMGVAATAYIEGTAKSKATRLRILALNREGARASKTAPGDLLVLATAPGGEQQHWVVDLAANDVTLPLPDRFAGGTLSFARAGIDGSRRMSLPTSQAGSLALGISAPATTSPNAPIPVKLHLADIEGQGLEGAATLWFRRASGDITASQRGWEPSLHIDATGATTATLTAPEAAGLWYVMGAAATAEGGYATAWSVIDVLPGPSVQLPPAQVAPAGEERAVSVAIYNPGDTRLSGALQAEGGPLQLVGNSSQSVDVLAGAWQHLDWHFAVPASAFEPERAGLVFSFLPSAGVEGTWTLGVQPGLSAHANTTYASGVLAGQKTIGVQVPSGLSDNSVGLEIHASSSLIAALADAAQTLRNAPQDRTVEVPAERLSAAPAIASAYRRAGLENPLAAASAGMERSLALQQLYSAQHADGGWGVDLDPTSGPSNPSSTANVLLAFWRQGRGWIEAGANPQPEIASDVQSRALAYLARQTMGPAGANPSNALLDERAHSFYVLSLYGAASLPAIRPFLGYTAAGSGGPRLSQAGTAWLALALSQAGSPADAQVLVNELVKTPLETQDAATIAPLLEALLTIKAPANGAQTQGANGDTPTPQSPATGPATEAQAYARALMEARQAALWTTPAGSADALWALAHYAPQEAEKQAGEPTLVLNDRVMQTTAPPSYQGTISVVLSGSTLHAGTNWLKLQALSATQPLYYSLTLRATR